MKVAVLSDRPSFRSLARKTLEAAGCEVTLRTCLDTGAPDVVGLDNLSVVVDGASPVYREDYEELLATVALLRARRLFVATFLHTRACSSSDQDLLAELCGGLVYYDEADIAAACRALRRRTDPNRMHAAEFATVTAAHRCLLIVLSSGRSLMCPRPIHRDDLGAVTNLQLCADSTALRIHTEEGLPFEVTVESLLRRFGRTHGAVPDANSSTPTSGIVEACAPGDAEVNCEARQRETWASETRSKETRSNGVERRTQDAEQHRVVGAASRPPRTNLPRPDDFDLPDAEPAPSEVENGEERLETSEAFDFSDRSHSNNFILPPNPLNQEALNQKEPPARSSINSKSRGVPKRTGVTLLESSAEAKGTSSSITRHVPVLKAGMPDGSEVGARIRLLRLQAGMTQEHLAKRLDVPRSLVANVESGTTEPPPYLLSTLMKVFGSSGRAWLKEFSIPKTG